MAFGTAEHDIALAAPAKTQGRAGKVDLIVELHADSEAIAALAPEWQRLADATPGTIVFQTPEFVTAWASAYCNAGGRALRIATVRERGSLVAFMLFVLERSGPFRVARLGGDPISQYDDLIIANGSDKTRIFGSLLATLGRECRVDVVRFSRVRADSALEAAAAGLAIPLGLPELAVHADLGDSGHDAFMQSRSKKVRNSVGKRRRQIARMGDLEFRLATDPEEAASWTREGLALKRLWLAETGRLSRGFIDPRFTACLAESARTLTGAAGRVGFRAARLALDGRTVAIEAGFTHRHTLHLYLGAFAPEFSKLSPGNVLTEAATRSLIDDGFRTYDMMAPISRNKDEWGTGTIAVRDYAVPLSLAGRVYVHAVARGIQPAVRAAFYRLPQRWRTWIAGRAIRA